MIFKKDIARPYTLTDLKKQKIIENLTLKQAADYILRADGGEYKFEIVGDDQMLVILRRANPHTAFARDWRFIGPSRAVIFRQIIDHADFKSRFFILKSD